MLENYLPILVFIAIGLGFGAFLELAGFLASPSKENLDKTLSYECGFSPFEDARQKFDVRFYLVAILFIVFDLEVAYLFPWSVVLDRISFYGFFSMYIFLFILTIGFLYEWWNGALDWE